MGKHPGKRRLLAANTRLYFVCRPEPIVGKTTTPVRKGSSAQYLPLPAFGNRKFGLCKHLTSVSQRTGILPLISYNPAADQAAAKKSNERLVNPPGNPYAG
jgi:hypothetical protein